MKWILGVSLMAVVAGMAATITVPAQTITPDEAIIKLFPRETDGIGFIDMAALRSSPLYNETMAAHFKAKQPSDWVQFGEATGFVVERDVNRVTGARIGGRQIVAVAHANYDKFKVEQYLNDKNTPAETYLGRLIFRHGREGGVSFIDNMVVVIGHTEAVKKVIDRMAAPAENVLQNPEIVNGIKTIEAGSQIWAVGRFDTNMLPMPPQMLVQFADVLKSLKSGTYQMRVDSDVHAVGTAQFADAETARATSDLFRGLVALAKFQVARQSDLLRILDGIRVEQSGLSMMVNFDASGDLLKRLQELKKSAAE